MGKCWIVLKGKKIVSYEIDGNNAYENLRAKYPECEIVHCRCCSSQDVCPLDNPDNWDSEV
ncbi:MAG: hypothetical protein ACTSXD_13540 [Candidatus Heimdallarchaeaceae archaeon]